MKRRTINKIKKTALAVLGVTLFSTGFLLASHFDYEAEFGQTEVETYTISAKITAIRPIEGLISVVTEDGELYDFYGDGFHGHERLILTMEKGFFEDKVIDVEKR